ncbi:MAG: homocysteine S-methyltransferase family protein, partial [Deltaproteobacteria bacterium]|nr:homocysteine S-methyltransferase family protein [Deltaproteobacteria bacterium]
MEKTLLDLCREKIIVFDGGMGTMLMAAGLAPGESPELWNVDHPERVEAVHRRYYEAGSDVVHTNTFGGNPLKLADRGLGDRMESVNRAGVLLARQACPEGKFVAGDIGPTGKMLKPLGDLSP